MTKDQQTNHSITETGIRENAYCPLGLCGGGPVKPVRTPEIHAYNTTANSYSGSPPRVGDFGANKLNPLVEFIEGYDK